MFSRGDVFIWHIKKQKVIDACTSRIIRCFRMGVWMIMVVKKNVMLCCDMRLDLLFFLGQRVYDDDDDVRFDASLIFFFPFISLICLDFHAIHEKKHSFGIFKI